MGDILFLAHRVPFPPNRGDKIRAHHLLRRLTQLGDVHVGCFSENEEDRQAISDIEAIAKSSCVVDRRKPLVMAGVEAVLSSKPVSLTAFHSPRLASWIEKAIAAHSIDTIVIFSGQMGQYIPEDFSDRVIVDLCDVDSAKFEGYAADGERVWLNAREARLLSQEEQRLGQRADVTILISENEAELYRSRLVDPKRANIQVIGNGIDAAFFDPHVVAAHPQLTAESAPQLVFTGQMDYRPNEQAALWVIDHLMPQLREIKPNAQFHVVGRNPTQSLDRRDGDNGARIWGEVPDVRPFLKGADAVLAPMTIARGVQNKVLEAMAMSCLVVLSEQAATGIDAVDGKHWRITKQSVSAMCDCLIELLDAPDKAYALGTAARQFVLEAHAWEAMLRPLDVMVSGTLEARHAA